MRRVKAIRALLYFVEGKARVLSPGQEATIPEDVFARNRASLVEVEEGAEPAPAPAPRKAAKKASK
jgi:hypothetical protein